MLVLCPWKAREEACVKAKEGVVEILNRLLTNDLTAINQYFIQAKMCENWGFERLAHKLREISFSEMKDAEQLIEQILYLEGVPNLQRLGSVRIGETVPEHLELDLRLEQDAVGALSEGVAHCARVEDYATRNLLEEMVRQEQEDIDWLETQLETIRQVGVQAYLAQQIRE
jgi:bacterioferritin